MARPGWGRGQHAPKAFPGDSQSVAGPAPAPEPGGSRDGSAERLLLDATRRAVRAPAERVALVLHLSRLGPPAPEPHHRRIARALLTEAAQRLDGQLFPLGNGDLALLCRAAHSRTPAANEPASLRSNLARLFGGEAAGPEAIVSLWPLPGQADLLLAYAAERLAAAEQFGAALRRDAIERSRTFSVAIPPEPAPMTGLPDFPEMLQRRTGALVARSGGTPSHALRPLFRELAFSPAALSAHYAPAGDTSSDPWLLRHFGGRLEEPLLALIEAALPGSGPIGMAGTPPGFALHLNLSTKTIMKERSAHVFRLSRSIGVPIGVEVSLVEAAAMPEAFAAARSVLRRAGLRIVLGTISHQALLLTRPQSLDADLFKLDWSARLARLTEPDRGALASAFDAIGRERVILNRADNEEAVLWGLGHGIRRFVGHHVEVMLAAGRMLACAAASGCTLGQCSERAASATAPGRRFCRNLSLLDSGAPSAAPS